MSRLINTSNVFDRPPDVSSRLGPAEGLSVLIPVVEPMKDGAFQAADAVEAASANRLIGDERKTSARQG